MKGTTKEWLESTTKRGAEIEDASGGPPSVSPKTNICKFCNLDLDRPSYYINGELISLSIRRKSNHDCYCLNENINGLKVRIAVGICCGRHLGKALLAEEDYHDGAPWSVETDCTCPKGNYVK